MINSKEISVIFKNQEKFRDFSSPTKSHLMFLLRMMLFLGLYSDVVCCMGSRRVGQRSLVPPPVLPPEEGSRSILYPSDWKPLMAVRDSEGRTWELEDYSFAGYRQSDEDLPVLESWRQIPVQVNRKVALVQEGQQQPLDLAPAILAALNEAKSTDQPIVLKIPAGFFTLGEPIFIDRDQLVLRGVGPDKTRFFINPDRGALTLGTNKGSRYTKDGWVLQKPVERGALSVEVKSSDGLSVGDDIVIKWRVSAEFAEEYKSGTWWREKPEKEAGIGGYVENFRRVIKRIDGDTIFFDAPMPLALSLRDEVAVHKFTAIVHDVGLEDLGISTAFPSREQAWSASTERLMQPLNILYCRDCWMKNIRSFESNDASEHLAGHGLKVDQAFRITLASIQLGPTQNLGGNGNGYLFMLGQVNHVLVKECGAVGGRHNLTFLGYLGSSQNVVTSFTSRGGRICENFEQLKMEKCGEGYIDTHHPLAISNLIENSTIDDGIYFGNRQWKSNYVGQTATQNVIWNVRGAGKIFSFNVGKGYVIGTGPEITVLRETNGGKISTAQKMSSLEEEAMYGTEPADFVEYLQTAETIVPKSLFNDQRNRRVKRS